MNFEKVSYAEWESCVHSLFAGKENSPIVDKICKESYENIKIPTRSTKDSAGYDFYCPINNLTLKQNYWLTVPLGIRWCGEDCTGKVLIIMPRSGLGFKKGLKLRNTLGVIDADYQYAKNEGHIMAKIQTDEDYKIDINKAILQGVILPYYKVEENEDVLTKRTGGFGSTDNK